VTCAKAAICLQRFWCFNMSLKTMPHLEWNYNSLALMANTMVPRMNGWYRKRPNRDHQTSTFVRGYSHGIAEDWKIVFHASVRGHHDNRDLCLELLSPVLQGNEGLAELHILKEHVRQFGISTNRTSGFHVHIDATFISLSGLQRICK
jgi:hypothetical protein